MCHSTQGCHDSVLPAAFGLRFCSSCMERIHHHSISQDHKSYGPQRLQTSGFDICSVQVHGTGGMWPADLLSRRQTGPTPVCHKAKRGVEDACLTLLDTVTKNMDHTHSCSRILFMDFSSAFNTVNTNTLSDCLTELQVNPVLVKWIRDFLQDRSKHVTKWPEPSAAT